MDPEIVAVAVGQHVGVEEAGDLDGAGLGVDLGQAAELLARAALDAAHEQGRCRRELLRELFGHQRLDVLVGHERDEDVLLVGQAHFAVGAAVLASEAHELRQLLGAQAADRDAVADRRVDSVALRRDADVVGAVEAAGRLDAAAQRALDAALELLAEGVGAHRVEQELEAGAAALGTQLLGVAEDRDDPLGDLGGLLRSDEDVDPTSEARGAGETATHADVEAGRAVLGDRAGEREVVDEAAGAVLGAAGDRDLELARQVGEGLAAQEVLVDGLGRGQAVDHLVVADAGQRAADDVAGDVTAGAGDRQAHLVEARVDLGDLVEGDPVDLEALARGAVDDPAPEVGGDARHRLGLVAGQDALDDLHAQHEVAVLGVVRVEPVPLQACDVVVGQRLPAIAGGSHEVRIDVQTILVSLDSLDLVHEGGGVGETASAEKH